MAFNYGMATMAVNVASSLIGGMAERKAIKAQNAANLAVWKKTYKEVRRQIGVAYGRMQDQELEVQRDKVRTQMAARTAGRVTKGSRAVKAAQLGIQGRRASRDIYVPVDREVANQVSDSEVNARIQTRNVINNFNDTAMAAINNLNANAPLSISEPYIGGILANAAGTALETYQGMSASQQNDFKNTFSGFDVKGGTAGVQYKVTAPKVGGRDF